MKTRPTPHRARLVIIVRFVANNFFKNGVQNPLLHYEVDTTPYIDANFIHQEFHHPLYLLFPSSSCFLGHESPQILSNRLKRLKPPQFSNTFARDYGCLALGPSPLWDFFLPVCLLEFGPGRRYVMGGDASILNTQIWLLLPAGT